MSKGYGAPAQTLGKKLGKASGAAPKQYPKVGGGKELNWKKPNTGGGKGMINELTGSSINTYCKSLNCSVSLSFGSGTFKTSITCSSKL